MIVEPSKRLLDPIDRVSEVLFGLIMVLTFTGSLSVAESGREDVRTMLIGALGCNIAWGVIDAMLYLRLWQEAPRNGYPVVECSWILEDNWDMRRALERMGARLYKTYRVYEKNLTLSEVHV